MRRRLGELVALGAVLCLTAPVALAADSAEQEREAALGDAVRVVSLRGAELRVEPAVIEGAAAGERIRFEVAGGRLAKGSTLTLHLPRQWVRPGISGFRATRPAQLVDGRGASLLVDGGLVVLGVGGDGAAFELTNVGLAPGTYELPLRWRPAGARSARSGHVDVRVLAGERENTADHQAFRAELNIGDPISDQGETAIATQPGNSDRTIAGIVGGVDGGLAGRATIDGGTTWAELPLPNSANAVEGPVEAILCCDPIAAVSTQGDAWFGGLACADAYHDCAAGARSRIVLDRIPPGQLAYASARTVSLPLEPNTVEQDKPAMTIDNGPSSPTNGRLYVVWNEQISGGALKIVISQCDTRAPAGTGTYDPARCDSPVNWSPVRDANLERVSPTAGDVGSYISASVTVGPDGRVYVAWWDFNAPKNAIFATSCLPSATATSCRASSDWKTSAIKPVAGLNNTGGPVPLNCPIVAQPGGRAGPAVTIAADHSPGAGAHGRIWISWSDLRAGSGTTRCASNQSTNPTTSELNFDSYVSYVDGTADGALPSASIRAIPVLLDGEGAAGSDDWFPALAIDQTNGQAYTSFYSTVGDDSRRTANYFVRSVSPPNLLGPLTKLTSAPSDFSANDCCHAGLDYGDYEGLDVTGGDLWPVWTDARGTDPDDGTPIGQLFVRAPGIPSIAPSVVEGTASDRDGRLEPGETALINTSVTNVGGATASISGRLTGLSAGLTAAEASAAFGPLGPGQSLVAPLQAVIGASAACPQTATGSVEITATQAIPHPASAAISIPVVCQDRKAKAVKDTKAPALALIAGNKKLTANRRGIFKFALAGPDEPATGEILVRSAKKVRLTKKTRAKVTQLAKKRLALVAAKPVTANVRLSRDALKLLKHKKKLKVVAQVTLTDAAGNASSGRLACVLVYKR